MSKGAEPRRHVTVVGGGFSGAIFARHLLRLMPEPVTIEIVEERPVLGAGVAYSADRPHQTTNIPAPRMSVDPADPTHFACWLEAAGHAAEEPYPRRSLFGAYMAELLATTAARHPASRLIHRRAHVEAITRHGGTTTIAASDGTTWRTDAAVLATGNARPLPPRPLARLADDPRVVLDPWDLDRLGRIGPGDRVLILGIGLSMGEAVAGLAAAGHHGPVLAIARRGRRAARGAVAAPQAFGHFAGQRPRSAVALLHLFRSEVRRAEAAGFTWRSVLVAARAESWALWDALPAGERRRFVRHLRPWYEALRHVMPDAVFDTLKAEEEAGRLRVMAASLRALRVDDGAIEATLHARHAPPDAIVHERFDAVINCTGPAYATLTEADPFWARLARAGLVKPDDIGLGVAVARDGRAIGADGAAQDDLIVLGTLARGTFGELTGVAELSRQAEGAAQTLVARLTQHDAPLRQAG